MEHLDADAGTPAASTTPISTDSIATTDAPTTDVSATPASADPTGDDPPTDPPTPRHATPPHGVGGAAAVSVAAVRRRLVRPATTSTARPPRSTMTSPDDDRRHPGRDPGQAGGRVDDDVELPEPMREGRPSVEAAERALVRRPTDRRHDADPHVASPRPGTQAGGRRRHPRRCQQAPQAARLGRRRRLEAERRPRRATPTARPSAPVEATRPVTTRRAGKGPAKRAASRSWP